MGRHDTWAARVVLQGFARIDVLHGGNQVPLIRLYGVTVGLLRDSDMLVVNDDGKPNTEPAVAVDAGFVGARKKQRLLWRRRLRRICRHAPRTDERDGYHARENSQELLHIAIPIPNRSLRKYRPPMSSP